MKKENRVEQTQKPEGMNHFHYDLCRRLKGGRMEIIMKRVKKYRIVILCLLVLCTTLVRPVQTKAAFNKTTAKKNVTVTYKKLPDGVLAVYKNKNNVAIKLTAAVAFRDGDNKNISKITQKNLCLAGNASAAFFFQTPQDEYGNPINYSSYKGTYSVAKSSYTAYSKRISVTSEIDTIETTFTASNFGKKTLTNIHATIVFYDSDGKIVGCSTKYLNCFKKNSTDQFSISYSGKSWTPAKVKVYIDWAY